MCEHAECQNVVFGHPQIGCLEWISILVSVHTCQCHRPLQAQLASCCAQIHHTSSTTPCLSLSFAYCIDHYLSLAAMCVRKGVVLYGIAVP